jgi:hypothetical protein
VCISMALDYHGTVSYDGAFRSGASGMIRFRRLSFLVAPATGELVQPVWMIATLIGSFCLPSLAAYAVGALPDYGPFPMILAGIWGVFAWAFAWPMSQLIRSARARTRPT